MNALKQLAASDQSPWLDYSKHSLVEKGDLRALIERQGLKGATSNPSNFEKAIGESDGYAIRSLTRTDLVRGQYRGEMSAYDRLIGDAMMGDATPFSRQDSAEAQWRIVDPILGNEMPVHKYDRSTWGPGEAAGIARNVGCWHDPLVASGPTERDAIRKAS